jgi:hypothetical protein
MSVFSQRHISNPLRIFVIPNYHFYRNDRFPGRKGGTTLVIRKGIPHDLIGGELSLPPCFNRSQWDPHTDWWLWVLLAAICKAPWHTWNDANIAELSASDISRYWLEIWMLAPPRRQDPNIGHAADFVKLWLRMLTIVGFHFVSNLSELLKWLQAHRLVSLCQIFVKVCVFFNISNMWSWWGTWISSGSGLEYRD